MPVFKAENYQVQAAAAESMRQELHKKYIELGFEWDGMDGYTAPAGYTPDDFQKVFDDICARRMDDVRKSLS